MANTTYGSPYVQSSDLVSGWPATSLSVADRIDDVSFKGNGVNNQTATYTTVLTDAGKTIVMNVGSANDLTIQASGSAAYEIGTMIRVVNKGAGTTTVKPTGGVTLNGGNITLAQNHSATVVNVATDVWSPIATPAPASTSALTLVTAQTFSSVASLNINNCFTSTYENYMLAIYVSNTVDNLLRFRMRVSGVDASGNDYGVAYLNPASASATETSGYVTYPSTSAGSAEFFIYKPAIATPTVYNVSGGNYGQLLIAAGRHNVSTAYDGITIYPASGSLTGTIRVYGLQNS